MRKKKEEIFNELNQLDRIEYRQLEDRINERWTTSNTIRFVNGSVYLVFVMLGFTLIMRYLNFELFLYFSKATGFFLIAFLVLMVSAMFVDIFSSIMKKKELEKLFFKFFEVKTKRK